MTRHRSSPEKEPSVSVCAKYVGVVTYGSRSLLHSYAKGEK